MLLEVKSLCTEFPVKRGVVRAVDDVSFEVSEGEILAIVGESGSGKSVTSLSVMGLLAEPGHVAGGEMTFDGKDLVHRSTPCTASSISSSRLSAPTSRFLRKKRSRALSTFSARSASPALRRVCAIIRTRCRAVCASAS